MKGALLILVALMSIVTGVLLYGFDTKKNLDMHLDVFSGPCIV